MPRLEKLACLLNISLEVELSPYYDGLELEFGTKNDVDATLIWFDSSRLDVAARQRVLELARQASDSSPGVFFLVVDEWDSLDDGPMRQTTKSLRTIQIPAAEDNGETLSKEEEVKYGHRFNSPRFRGFIAEFVLKHLSTCLYEPIRMLAVDFDNTLYSGVLGEDGVSGLVFLDEHKRLWQLLVELQNAGLILVGITKNAPEDIQKLFDYGSPFSLPKTIFTQIYAGWESKSRYLSVALEMANLDSSQCAFLDDNQAELFTMESNFPGVYLLDSSDPSRAVKVLSHGPRIPSGFDPYADVRRNDLSLRRERIDARAGLGRSVHEALESRVEVGLASTESMPRCQELVLKTNQFNVSLLRTSLGNLTDKAPLAVICASVSDKFGQSGIVATVVAYFDDQGAWVIQEYCVSCRILGRELEDYIFVASVRLLQANRPSTVTRIVWSSGTRNEPAIKWLSRVRGDTTSQDGGVLEIKESWINSVEKSEYFDRILQPSERRQD